LTAESKPQLKKSLLYGILSGGGSFFVKVAIMILLTPVIIHKLGVEAYGAYLLFLNFSEMAKLLATGMTTGFVNQYSKALANTVPQEKNSLLQVGLLVYLTLGTGVVALGWFCLPLWITTLFKGATLSYPVLLDTGLIVLLTSGLAIFSEYLLSILFAHCLQAITHWVNTAQTILCGVVSVLALMAGQHLPEIFMGRLVVMVGIFMVLLLLVYRFDNQFASSFKQQDLPRQRLPLMQSFKRLLGISIFSMIQRVSVFIAHRLDEVVVATFLSLTQVSVLGVIVRVFSQVSDLMIKLLDGLFPVFSRLHADSSQSEKARYLFLRSMGFIHYTVSLFLMVVVAGFPEILHFLSAGQVSLSQSWLTMLFMAGLTWTGSVQIPASNYLFSSGMYRFQTCSTVITASINLICSLMFVQWIGLPGVVLGSLLPHGIQNHAVTIHLAIRRLGISWLQLVKEVYFRSLPALLVGAVPLCLIRYRFGSTRMSLGVLALVATVSVASSVLTWLLFSLDKTEQSLVLEQLAGLLKRVPGLRKKLLTRPKTVNFSHPAGALCFPVYPESNSILFSELLSYQPLVSIIVPCYNASLFLPELIRSIQAQTYSHWELILIDDHSTDDTRAVLSDYAKRESRIQTVYLDQNRGKASSVRNVGIQLARGDYITFVDADDACFVTALEQLLQPFDKHPEVNVAVAFPYYADLDMNPLYPSGEILETAPGRFQFAPGTVFTWTSICQCSHTFSLASSMFKREVFNSHGLLNEALLNGEDFQYIVSLLDGNWDQVRFLPTCTFLYRQYQGSVTKNAARIEESLNNHDMLADWLFARKSLSGGNYQQWKGLYLTHRYRAMVAGATLSGHRNLGRHVLWKAFSNPYISFSLFLRFLRNDMLRLYCPEPVFHYYLQNSDRARRFKPVEDVSPDTLQSASKLASTRSSGVEHVSAR
jgi:glycosyltransferase involved in cell wall biosynthesis/O-antigen/teichoic acid export membrane protein